MTRYPGVTVPALEATLVPAAARAAVEGLRARGGRIAVLRALHLGDLLVAVPALRALRAGFPRAEIALIGLPWAAELVRRLPASVDSFVAFPGYPGLTEIDCDPRRTEVFLDEQRARGYDLVVQMHGSGGQSNPLAVALGGRVTAGYTTSAAPCGLDIAAPYPYGLPEIERNLGLARLLGCPESGRHLDLALLPGDRHEAAVFLAPLGPKDRPWVGLHCGASVPSRRWGAHKFAAVARQLSARYGARVVLTGVAGDLDIVRAVVDDAPDVLDLCGRTSLGGLAAVLARLDLLVGNDTGPAHLAEAVGTPTVRLFGPADPQRWAPLDARRHRVVRHAVECSPCAHRVCPIDHRCLERVRPEDVIAAACEIVTALGRGVTRCDA